jgi:hypothetical protein
MSKSEEYQKRLAGLNDWMPYLRKQSGLPGPRGNLELAAVVAAQASPHQIEALLSIPREQAPENTANVFLVFCGVSALGRLAARGDDRQLARLRGYASDPRWRIREAVAIGLQNLGDARPDDLLREMHMWRQGNWYEKRAAAAALAEPRLLKEPRMAAAVLKILDAITADIEGAVEAKSDAYKTLRKSLGYCWSVAVAALPEKGKRLLEKWITSRNPDIQWIVKSNLSKSRLARLDPKWVESCLARLPGRPAKDGRKRLATHP